HQNSGACRVIKLFQSGYALVSDADFRHDLRNEVFYRDVLKLLKCFCRGQTHPFNRLVLYFEVSNRRTHDVEGAIRAWIDRRNGAAVIIQEQDMSISLTKLCEALHYTIYVAIIASPLCYHSR